jgi:hypothetical protein
MICVLPQTTVLVFQQGLGILETKCNERPPIERLYSAGRAAVEEFGNSPGWLATIFPI